MADDLDPYYTWLGIPPKDQPPNHYRLLGLELFESNPDVIENAADRQMAHVRTVGSARHQDVSQRVLNEIATARLCLLNEEKKAAYDAELRAKIAPPATANVQRAVRRAEPLPGTPAVPRGLPAEPGLIVRPLYSQGQPLEPAAPPLGAESPLGPSLGIELGYSLAPQATRSAPTLSRRRPSLVPVIALGAAVGLATVFGLWLLLRGGGSGGGQVVQNPGASRPEGDPKAVDPAKKTTDPGTKSPPEAKTSPAPETKQPVETPAEPSKTGVGELPPYALRFNEQARVELSNSVALLELLRAYTVEVWVKPTDHRVPQGIVGNLVVGNLHPDVGEGKFLGWLLADVQTPDKGLGLFVLRSEQGSGGHVPSSVAGQWAHLAVCFDRDREVLFFNGKRLSAKKASLPLASLSPICLGVPPYGGQADRVRFDGEICGLRISNGVRYPQPFTPSPKFEADADALVVLDFSQPQADQVRDLSGKNYHGRISGARWIETRTGNYLNQPDKPGTKATPARPPAPR